MVGEGDIPGAIMDISPWIDMRARPFDEIVATIKEHLADYKAPRHVVVVDEETAVEAVDRARSGARGLGRRRRQAEELPRRAPGSGRAPPSLSIEAGVALEGSRPPCGVTRIE